LTRKQLDARHLVLRFALLLCVAAVGCSAGGPELSEAAERGKATYFSVCIACHNAKPTLDALGPPIAGASREVLEARVVHGTYPPGYEPKRKSQAMPAFPHLAPNIDDLAAYLAECCPAN
jgi:mono/diheme cytochrome c family protein